MCVNGRVITTEGKPIIPDKLEKCGMLTKETLASPFTSGAGLCDVTLSKTRSYVFPILPLRSHNGSLVRLARERNVLMFWKEEMKQASLLSEVVKIRQSDRKTQVCRWLPADCCFLYSGHPAHRLCSCTCWTAGPQATIRHMPVGSRGRVLHRQL